MPSKASDKPEPGSHSPKTVAATMTRWTSTEEAFPLLDLPPELWIRCCQLAVISCKPIEIEATDNAKVVQTSLYQPPITKTCRVIRAETLHVFYKANEFRFLDDGECALKGFQEWVKAIPRSYLPLVRRCTVESKHSDIIGHLQAEFKEGGWEVEFDRAAPSDGATRVLRFMTELLPSGSDSDGDGGDDGDATEQETDEDDEREDVAAH